MHDNFKKIIYYSGKFGIIIREQAEELVYKGAYGRISANNTFAKLEKSKLLKRIDRGKKKTDGFKLTHDGVKLYRELFGGEPKVYNSGDKLNHAIQVFNFYIRLLKDGEKRNLYNIEEKNLMFNVHKSAEFIVQGKNRRLIADGFGLYKYKEKGGLVFHLEIENSDRKAHSIAKKTLDNYEGYYLSGLWKNENWQPEKKIFPPILIVVYSDMKLRELLKHFKSKIKMQEIRYFFASYKELKEHGISGEIWKDINGNKIKILN